MISVFSEFRNFYPDEWNSMFRNQGEMDAALIRWDDALSDMADDQIKNGIENCKRRLKKFPTVDQFVQMARSEYKQPRGSSAEMQRFISEFNQQYAESRQAQSGRNGAATATATKENPATAMKEKISESLDTFYESDNEQT